jgi:hypothetical protein
MKRTFLKYEVKNDFEWRIFFREVTPCSLVEVHQPFGGTYCLHLQGQRVSQVSNSKK